MRSKAMSLVCLLLAAPAVASATDILFPTNPAGFSPVDGNLSRVNNVATGIDAILELVDINTYTNSTVLQGGFGQTGLAGTTSNNLFLNLATTNPSSTPTNLDPETGLATPGTGNSSARFKIHFVNTGSTITTVGDIPANLAAAADYTFTFYDIDPNGSNRRRIDTITGYDVDGYYVEGGVDPTLLTVTVNPDSSVIATTPSTVTAATDINQANYMRHAISFLWEDTSTIEFQWSYPYTQRGVRGVEIEGEFPPGTPYVDADFFVVPEPRFYAAATGLLLMAFAFWTRSRRLEA